MPDILGDLRPSVKWERAPSLYTQQDVIATIAKRPLEDRRWRARRIFLPVVQWAHRHPDRRDDMAQFAAAHVVHQARRAVAVRVCDAHVIRLRRQKAEADEAAGVVRRGYALRTMRAAGPPGTLRHLDPHP